MILNLLNVVSVNDNKICKEVVFEQSEICNSLGEFSVRRANPFELSITHVKDTQLIIKGETEIVLEVPCDRCLKPVETEISIIIDKDIKLNEVANNLHMIEEQNYIDGYNLDVDKLLYSEILIGWPMKILCFEDCNGVCNVCGQNLNEGTCSCEDTGIDPRMSVIRDVFKNFKEV